MQITALLCNRNLKNTIRLQPSIQTTQLGLGIFELPNPELGSAMCLLEVRHGGRADGIRGERWGLAGPV